MSKTNDTYRSLNRDVMKAGGPSASDGKFKQWLLTKEGQPFQERWNVWLKAHHLGLNLSEEVIDRIREGSWRNISDWLRGKTTRGCINDSLALLSLEDCTKAEVRVLYQIKEGIDKTILNDKKVQHSPFRRRKCRHRK